MDKKTKEYEKRYSVVKNEKGELETKFSSFFKEGKHILQERTKVKQGRKSKSAGLRFEAKVRKYWEDKKWSIDKWSNNVNLQEGKLTIAKRKYNPYKKVMAIGTGFPDFIGIQFIREGIYNVMGIEVKINGILSKEEKDKCKWYLKNKIFGKILVAKKGKKRGEIEHIDFEEKWCS